MKILVINTGGTMTCHMTPRGMRPEIPAQELFKGLWRPEGMEFKFVNLKPLRDSGDVDLKCLAWIARRIAKSYNKIDAVLVIAGTGKADRILAGLSLIFKLTLQIPGIVVGSKLAPEEPGSDVRQKLETALRVTKAFVENRVVGWNYVWPDDVWHGSRLVEVAFGVFMTPGYMPVAHIRPAEVDLLPGLRYRNEGLAAQGVRLDLKFERRVYVYLSVTVDNNPWLLRAMADSGLFRGVILEVPDPPKRKWSGTRPQSWIDGIAYATQKGVIVAIRPPYPGGQLGHLTRYQLGYAADQAGALTMGGLTPAMADVKFRQAIALYPDDRDAIQQFLSMDFVGELLT